MEELHLLYTDFHFQGLSRGTVLVMWAPGENEFDADLRPGSLESEKERDGTGNRDNFSPEKERTILSLAFYAYLL